MPFTINELSKSPWLLNGICPYFTMFPIHYPVQVLNNTKNAVVFDPFCGRGTSLFAARMFGFMTYGIDSNPVAAAISKAKLTNTTVDNISKTLIKAMNYDSKLVIPNSEFWQIAYTKIVLAQLCRIRGYLIEHDGPEESALRGIILGALHGPKPKKIENASYFGNQMPRTYAPKPAYSVRYWKSLNLLPDNIDIKKIVARRATRYYKSNMPTVQNNVIYGDSRDVNNYHHIPEVSVIITSPPYYGMQTYYTDQWLRNWFLGGPDKPEHGYNRQLCHNSPQKFAHELSEVWKNCATISQEKTRIYVRYGGISSRSANPKEVFEHSIALTNGTWKILNIKDAGSSLRGKRQANQMLLTTNKKSKPSNEFDVELILNA